MNGILTFSNDNMMIFLADKLMAREFIPGNGDRYD